MNMNRVRRTRSCPQNCAPMEKREKKPPAVNVKSRKQRKEQSKKSSTGSTKIYEIIEQIRAAIIAA